MSEKTEPKPAAPNAPSPAPEHADPAKKPETEHFHPGKHHDHMVIQPPATGVPHVDPGAVHFP